jgi:hypothetical protein
MMVICAPCPGRLLGGGLRSRHTYFGLSFPDPSQAQINFIAHHPMSRIRRSNGPLQRPARRKSVIPVAFWFFSICGGVLLLIYALYRRDPVFIAGSGAGIAGLYPQSYFIIVNGRQASASDKVLRTLSCTASIPPCPPSPASKSMNNRNAGISIMLVFAAV